MRKGKLTTTLLFSSLFILCASSAEVTLKNNKINTKGELDYTSYSNKMGIVPIFFDNSWVYN